MFFLPQRIPSTVQHLHNHRFSFLSQVSGLAEDIWSDLAVQTKPTNLEANTGSSSSITTWTVQNWNVLFLLTYFSHRITQFHVISLRFHGRKARKLGYSRVANRVCTYSIWYAVQLLVWVINALRVHTITKHMHADACSKLWNANWGHVAWWLWNFLGLGWNFEDYLRELFLCRLIDVATLNEGSLLNRK